MDASVALGVISSSSRRFLAIEPYDHFAYGMHGLSLLSDFCSCGRCLHYPLFAYLDLSPVRSSKSCLAVKSLRVPFGVNLILPFSTVLLVKARVLPTDDTNCKDSIQGLGPTVMRFWPKEPWIMNL